MTGRWIVVLLLLLGAAFAPMQLAAKHAESEPVNWAPSPSFISIDQLRLPPDAAREFGKASRQIAKRNWDKAIVSLRKGLSLYPNSATAYNDLGAVYSVKGKNLEARQALEQAIKFDDHL